MRKPVLQLLTTFYLSRIEKDFLTDLALRLSN